MKNMLKIKKNQHYVPQSYLRRFTIEGEKSLLWEFEKKSSQFKRTTSSVNKICSEDYYYYQQDGSGGFDHIKLEDSLSEIEKVGNDILIKIINSHAMPYSCITEQEQGQFSFYISLMLTRGPAFRDCINELHGEIVWREFEISNRSGKLPDMPEVLGDLVKRKGLKNAIKAEIFSSVSLEYMIKAANQMALSLLKKNWELNVISSEDEFVTSDTPVVFTYDSCRFNNIGPAHPNTKITFPISNKLAITINGLKTSQYIKNVPCRDEEVLSINKIIVDAANHSIFFFLRFEWLENLSLNNVGQKMTMNSSGDGYEIIRNPHARRKLTRT